MDDTDSFAGATLQGNHNREDQTPRLANIGFVQVNAAKSGASLTLVGIRISTANSSGSSSIGRDRRGVVQQGEALAKGCLGREEFLAELPLLSILTCIL